MGKFKSKLFVLGMIFTIYPINVQQLNQALTGQKNPFSYDLGVKLIPSKHKNAGTTICCHGYGSSSYIANIIHSFNVLPDHIIGFNFPDYDLNNREYDPYKSVFGTIHEILPLLYVIRRCVIDAKLASINLYGFSAGGGAIINMLAVLNCSTYDEQLSAIGITRKDKKEIIAAIQRGHIILDCPLKSVDEIMAIREKTPEFIVLAERYRNNNMRPIDAMNSLEGLILNVIVHFQQPDEIVGNCDDDLFIARLRKANKGTTNVVLGNDGGHNESCIFVEEI